MYFDFEFNSHCGIFANNCRFKAKYLFLQPEIDSFPKVSYRYIAMKKHILLLILILLVPFSMQAAQKGKFSKNYKNARLEVVLADLCKRYDYQLVVDKDDIDMEKRITASFKNATPGAVLKKVLDKDLTYKVRKGTIFINKKPLPPKQFTSVAVSPSSVEENDSLKLTVWNDTVFNVTCKTVTKEEVVKGDTEKITSQKKQQETYKGHHLWASIGGGYADLGYKLREGNNLVGKEHGSLGGIVQLQYAYFFHEHWGVSAGVGFSHYTAYGTLNHQKRFAGQTDSDGERYTHVALTRNWKERQAAYMLDIPVEVLFHQPVSQDVGIYAGIGVKAGVILNADYRLRNGALEHAGEYGDWGLTLSEVNGHDFYSEQIGTDFSKDKQALKLKLPAIGLMADLGMSVRLTDQLNLLVGAFFNYTCNNVRENSTTEMGWQQSGYSGEQAYRNHDFMNSYAGEIASEYVTSVRPWEVGLKIGIDWRHKEKTKPQTVQKNYVRVQVCDTTYTLKQRIDTVYKPKPQAVQQIVRLMETSVIWYDLDSTEPKLQPADILDKIAAILIENPQQHIQINGHASKEGTALHNKRLSENRAQVIYDMLLQKGVKKDQMTTQGFGVEKSYQEGEHEISLDRRVEIIPINE